MLKSVPLLSSLSDEALYMLTTIFSRQTLTKGEMVIQEGTNGDHFYVVHDGSVLVTQWSSSLKSQVELDVLGSGQYFGEIALLTRASRTASVQVVSEKCEMLVMHREDFQQFMAPFEKEIEQQMHMREYQAMEKHGRAENAHSGVSYGLPNEDGQISWIQEVEGSGKTRGRHESMECFIQHADSCNAKLPPVVLEDLEVICNLGVGTFGKVVMVSHRLTGKVSALKCLQKAHLLRTAQQHNVRREKAIMQVMNHPFIIKLNGTLSDNNQVYFLLEYIPGGELWSLLYDRTSNDLQCETGPFGGVTLRSAMLYAAMALSAFEHIHELKFAYRDLKPENLLLTETGYLKVVDFGFAKRLPYTSPLGKTEDRTYTLCGTPEYMAPEIILSRGHDKSVDYWALGILVYELLCGATPFEADSQQETFERIVYSQRYLRFPLGFDPHAKSLVRKLLNSNAALRLGALKGGLKDIKEHLFFSSQNMDWEELRNQNYVMDYVPTLSGKLDHSHFKVEDENEDGGVGDIEEYVIEQNSENEDIFADF